MAARKLLLGALVASTLGIASVPAAAAVGIYLEAAPPAPRYEVVPAPRRGFVWAPGYWNWRHGHYAWVRGHWIRERHGYYWHPDRWERRDGRWVLERGGWRHERWEHERFARRDRDHDGVPDWRDPAPDNPRVR